MNLTIHPLGMKNISGGFWTMVCVLVNPKALKGPGMGVGLAYFWMGLAGYGLILISLRPVRRESWKAPYPATAPKKKGDSL